MWKLKFISKENFYKHIQDTIEKYLAWINFGLW